MLKFLKKFFIALVIIVTFVFAWAFIAHFFVANTMLAPTLATALEAAWTAVLLHTPLGLFSGAHFASGLMATGVLGASVGTLTYFESESTRDLEQQAHEAQAQVTQAALELYLGQLPELADHRDQPSPEAA